MFKIPITSCKAINTEFVNTDVIDLNPHESKYVTLTSMYEPGMKLCHVEYQIYNTHVIEPSIDNVESYENQYTIKINVTNILDTPVKIFKEQIKVHPVDLEEPIESTVNTNDFIFTEEGL